MKHFKILLLAASLLAVVLLLLGGWRLSRSLARAREARAVRDREFNRLKELYASKPFPSAANVRQIQHDTEALAHIRGTMTEAVSAGNIPLQELSPSLFIQALQRSLRDRLLGQAPIVDGARVVPDNFAFGFDRYLGAGAPMPAVGDVPRLAQQLKMVERLVDEIYAARIGALRALRRAEFETVVAAAEPDMPAAARRREGRAAAAAALGMVETPLYHAQRFSLELSGHQTAICDLLNRLAAMDLFVIVTEVNLRKRAEDIKTPPPPETVAPAAAPKGVPLLAAALTAAPGKPQPPPPLSALPVSQRLMCGPDVDPPLDARIELEIYTFHHQGT